MNTQLLSANMGVWIAVGAGAFALLIFLYGVFRRFTRCSWLSWQVWLVFAALLLLPKLPQGQTAATRALIPAVALIASVAVVLVVGGFMRSGFLAYGRKTPAFFRFTNRFLGGVTSVLNFVTFFVVLAAPVLAALPVFGVEVSALGVIYENPVWTEFFAGHALDLFVVAVCILMVRCGYRVGLLRSLWALLTIALGVGAVVLAVILATKVPFLTNWASSLAGSFSSLGAYANTVGTAIVAAVCFVVLLIVVILISALINMLMTKVRTPTALRAVDGALLAVVFAAFFFAVAYGVNFGVHFLAHGDLEGLLGSFADMAGSSGDTSLAQKIAEIGQKIESFFLSSPLSARLYESNPFLLIGGEG